MADPEESEDIKEELSTEELKSVSGGSSNNLTSYSRFKGSGISNNREGSGSGMTLRDWEKDRENKVKHTIGHDN